MDRSKIEWTRRARRVVFFLGTLCVPAAALANSIVVGNHNLQPNQAGQVVNLIMTGSDGYNTSDFGLLINGGLAGAPVVTHVFGVTTGTAFSAADLAGSIWEGGGGGIGSQFPYGTANVGTGRETIAALYTAGFTSSTASGIYVSLTFNTAGVAPGVYSFSLTENPVWPTRMFSGLDDELEPIPVPLDIINGTLTVVPEPASMMLGLFAIVGLAVVTIRSQRRQSAAERL
jgi:hypothetical protein